MKFQVTWKQFFLHYFFTVNFLFDMLTFEWFSKYHHFPFSYICYQNLAFFLSSETASLWNQNAFVFKCSMESVLKIHATEKYVFWMSKHFTHFSRIFLYWQILRLFYFFLLNKYLSLKLTFLLHPWSLYII